MVYYYYYYCFDFFAGARARDTWHGTVPSATHAESSGTWLVTVRLLPKHVNDASHERTNGSGTRLRIGAP